MKYKAIISDTDGTLTRNMSIKNRQPLPSKKVVESIKKAQEKGIVFVLATARPMQFIEYLLDSFTIKGMIILDNGAAIYNLPEKSLVWESLMDNESVSEMLQIAEKYAGKYGIGLSTREGRVQNPKEITPDMHVRRINVRSLNAQQADAFIKEIEQLEKDISITRPSSSYDTRFEDVLITNAQATKQHAVLRVAEILKISTQKIIGIGDHYNDFPLLEACGLKVAMGNAVPDLKAIADYIAPSVGEDGVADVIEKFVLSHNLS